MSLSKASVPIVFQGGLDQKTDPKISVAGKFQKLENCIREKSGRIQKRYGLSAVGSASSAMEAVVTYDEAPVRMGATAAEAYSPTSATWRTASSSYTDPVPFTSTSIFRNTAVQQWPSSASGGGYTMTVFVELATLGATMRYVSTEDVTGRVVSSGIVAFPSYTAGGLNNVKVHYLTGPQVFVIIYQDVTAIKAIAANPLLGTLGATYTVASTVTASDYVMLDSCVAGASRIGFVVPKATGAGYVAGYATYSSGAITGTTVSTSTANSVKWSLGVGYNSKYDTLYVMYSGAADTLIHITAYNSTLANSTSVTFESISSAAGLATNPAGSIAVTFDDNGDSAYVFYSIGTGPTTYLDRSVKYQALTTTWSNTGVGTLATSGSATVAAVQSVLWAKPFRISNVVYLPVATGSPLQAGYYLTKAFAPNALSQVGYGYGVGFDASFAFGTKSYAADVVVNSLGKYVIPAALRTKAQVGPTFVSLDSAGINLVSFDMTTRNPRNYAHANKALIFAGGVPTVWDGSAGAEFPFLMYPEGASVGVIAGGSMTVGNYSFRFIYEWVDAKGQTYRSAPSTAINVSTTSGNQRLNVQIPNLPFTGLPNVRLITYMTKAGGSTYYRCSYPQLTLQNATGSGYTTVSAVQPSVTGAEEILYTTGGTLDNTALPACTCVRAHRNRIWAGGLEDGTVAYSREMTAGEGVAFSDALRIPMDDLGGNVTALGSLDDKLLIFKKRKVYYIYGEGPLDSGLQSDYPLPQVISHDVGCSDPNLVVEGPFGVMFKSERGFYLVNRGLAVDFVGKDVVDHNGLTFTSATVLADRNEVRFTTVAGTGLVYNYEFRQWSTFTNYAGISATYANGEYYIMRSTSGNVVKEVSGTFDDAGSRYSMTIETSWLSMAGLQGFQRCYSFELLGDLISNHYTQVSFAYDFETTYNETITYDTRQLTTNIYQVEYRPKRQKCDAIKIKIVDDDSIGVSSGASLNMVALTAVVGRKMGSNRLPAARKA